jgi:hypothetical protein
MELGVPSWTTGQFTRVVAQDDLGIESVGAELLGRLIPGMVQNTPNAGYYSFYPYLIARWERDSTSVARADFREFYRRQEAAFALACSMHAHRHEGLGGINGSLAARQISRSSGDMIDMSLASRTYMQSTLGGYGLFYQRALENARLTRIGQRGYVDKPTDLGRQVAESFGTAFEATEYYHKWEMTDSVPRGVLEELGQAVCLCGVPGRADQHALLQVFVGPPLEDPAWEDQRQRRVRSLALFMAFHDQRPAGVAADVDIWRRVLMAGAYPNGTRFRTPFTDHYEAWRAYQYRECEVMSLLSIWCAFLDVLDDLGQAPQEHVCRTLLARCNWTIDGLLPDQSLRDAMDRSLAVLPTGDALCLRASELEALRTDPSASVTMALTALLALVGRCAQQGDAFTGLMDAGGVERWSLRTISEWVEQRRDLTAAEALAELLDDLMHRHVRVALSKMRAGDPRDPFCIAEDDGMLRRIRADEPFWTGARYGVSTHLLWTLGLLDAPTGEPRLTPLGSQVLTSLEADG